MTKPEARLRCQLIRDEVCDTIERFIDCYDSTLWSSKEECYIYNDSTKHVEAVHDNLCNTLHWANRCAVPGRARGTREEAIVDAKEYTHKTVLHLQSTYDVMTPSERKKRLVSWNPNTKRRCKGLNFIEAFNGIVAQIEWAREELF